MRKYWGQNANWYQAMYALAPVFEMADVVFPSVYDYYGTDVEEDHARYGEIVRFALELVTASPWCSTATIAITTRPRSSASA